MKTDKLVMLILILIVVLLMYNNTKPDPIPRPVPVPEPVTDINWLAYEDVCEATGSTGTVVDVTKVIWFYFSLKDSCPPCRELESGAFKDDDVKSISKQFTCVKLDNPQWAEAFKVTAFPSFMFGYITDGNVYIKRVRDIRSFVPPQEPSEVVQRLQEGL